MKQTSNSKRLSAVLLTLCMTLELMPATAFAAETVSINETNFPDENFRACVTAFDYDSDGFLSGEELLQQEYLDVNDRNITNLKGIEHFKNLISLSCSNNALTSLDISSNTALQSLYCWKNELSFLDVSSNTALEFLDCGENYLTSLDVSQNPALEILGCSKNSLTELNISSNYALQALSCSNNFLTSLDISSNPELQELWCGWNNLTSLNTVNNPLLEDYYFGSGSYDIQLGTGRTFDLSTLPAGFDVNKTSNWSGGSIDGSILTAEENVFKICYEYDCGNDRLGIFNLYVPVPIDNSHFPDKNFRTYVTQYDWDSDGALSGTELLRLDDMDISALNIASVKGIEYFENLETLVCDNNTLTSLDISKNPLLKQLSCIGNKLTTLDVSQNLGLELIQCDDNILTQLDVSNNRFLDSLNCTGNNLTSLDVSKNPALESCYFIDNSYDISIGSDRTFDLSTLPEGFDVNKTSNWTGGSVSGNILTVDKNAAEVTYEYACGNDKTATFTLEVTAPAESDLTVTLSSDKFEVNTGKLMKFTASATGGTGNYTYNYVIRYSGKEERIHAAKTSSVCRYKMAKPGTKEVVVTVTDSNGNQATGSYTVTVK